MSFNDFRSCYGFTLRYIGVFDGAFTLVNFSTTGGLLTITSTKTFSTFFAPLTVIRLSEAQNSILTVDDVGFVLLKKTLDIEIAVRCSRTLTLAPILGR